MLEACTEALNLLWKSRISCLSFVLICAPVLERTTRTTAKSSMVASNFCIFAQIIECSCYTCKVLSILPFYMLTARYVRGSGRQVWINSMDAYAVTCICITAIIGPCFMFNNVVVESVFHCRIYSSAQKPHIHVYTYVICTHHADPPTFRLRCTCKTRMWPVPFQPGS